MNSSGHHAPSPAPSLPLRGRRGFTLLQLGLALLCGLLAAYVALTELRKFQQRAQCDQFVAEVRALAAHFESYHAQKGEWPAATNAEVRIPRGLESTLTGTPWLHGPPFGGNYDWIPPLRRSPADDPATPKPIPAGMIAVTAFSPSGPLPLTPIDLTYIDGKLDDGNLSTGRFRTGFNGWPVYLVNSSR